MKKSVRNLFFAAMIAGGSLTGFSATAKQPENINEAIITRLKADSLPANEKAVVYVSFSVDKNGNVEVLELNGSDANYLSFVKSNLQDLNLSEFVTENGKTYYYKICFNKV
jgi:hypothetical protein